MNVTDNVLDDSFSMIGLRCKREPMVHLDVV